MFASIITGIITTLIGLFLYEDVLLKDSELKNKAMLKAIQKINPELKSWYSIKLKRVISLLRTIYML